MLISDFRPLVPVQLPYSCRQFYMHQLDIADPTMPDGFADYLPPVRALLAASGVRTGTAYVTVDEKVITAGMSQRRPGPHVDGCFMPEQGRWGGGGHWNHGCNRVPFARMPIIVAASVPGCKAWRGDFDATPTEDGDLSHMELGEGELLPPNVGYLLSPDCVHESMRFAEDTQRTFLRIALPVGSFTK
jgi:hypothetical protein